MSRSSHTDTDTFESGIFMGLMNLMLPLCVLSGVLPLDLAHLTRVGADVI